MKKLLQENLSAVSEKDVFTNESERINFNTVQKKHDNKYIVPTSSDNLEAVINFYDDRIIIWEKKEGSEDLIASVRFNKKGNGFYCYSFKEYDDDSEHDWEKYLNDDDDDDDIDDIIKNVNQNRKRLYVMAIFGIISGITTSLLLKRKRK